jgi:hypothetical protein
MTDMLLALAAIPGYAHFSRENIPLNYQYRANEFFYSI